MIQTQQAPLSLPVAEQVEITDSGLKMPANMPFENWLQVGRKLMLADKAVQWAIGDWWIYGDHRYGERASAAIDPATGENRLTRYMDYGWVARSIETSRRREVLSWSAHKEVAAIPPKIQDQILDRAVDNGWGSREVRAAVREYKKNLEQPERTGQSKIIDYGGAEDAEVVEEDKPVFDASDAGARLGAEDRREKLQAFAEQQISEPRQKLLDALATGESAVEPGNLSQIKLKLLNAARIRSLGKRLLWLADEVDRANGITLQSSAGFESSSPRPVDEGRAAPLEPAPTNSSASADEKGGGAPSPANTAGSGGNRSEPRSDEVVPGAAEGAVVCAELDQAAMGGEIADSPPSAPAFERDRSGMEQPPEIPEFLRKTGD